MNIHQLSKAFKIAGFQRGFAFSTHVLDKMQVRNHLLIVLFTFDILLVEHGRGRPGVARIEHQEVVLQVIQGIGVDVERPCLDLIVG